VLVVQGAPGTGKTAVALHRAAYLLYAERDSFHQHGILFVGPNQTFLRYVEEVVPSLGEDRVVLASPSELGPEVTVDRDEAPAVVRLKGDARMVAVLEQAVADRERAGKDGASIPCGRFTLTLGNDVLRQVAARGRKAKGTHNARRASVERALLAALQRELDAAEARDVKLGRIAVADERKILDVVDRAAVAAIANRLWPILTPETLLTSLYASPRRCARAGRGVLHEEEITLLVREKDDLGWSEADVALLDELATLLGPLPEPRRPRRSAPVDPMIERVLADLIPDCPVCGSELTYISRGSQPQDDRFRCDRCLPVRYFHTYTVMGDMAAQHLRGVHDSLVSRNTGTTTSAFRTGDVRYGHVVVDEAQDLSAMQWRAIARRCPSRSMTIAGDQGQAIRAGGTGTWDAAVAAVGAGSYDLAELTVNYRTPAEVMVAAEAVLTAAGVGFSRTRSVRSTQRPVAIVVDAIDASAVQRALDTIEVEGTRAVIAPLARLDELGALGCQVLDVREAKGLEFDAVVVVEPEVIVDEGEGGARRLYVALTRTTNQLRVVTATTDGLIGALLEHCEPAPI
jgi:DNA helicase IV